MPISSGATGRVGVGVDTSIAWTPEGWKQDGSPFHRSRDSYLIRYLETHPEAKKRSNNDTSVVTHDHRSNQRPKGKNTTVFAKDLKGETNSQHQHDSQDGDSMGNRTRESTTHKSSMCAIL